MTGARDAERRRHGRAAAHSERQRQRDHARGSPAALQHESDDRQREQHEVDAGAAREFDDVVDLAELGAAGTGIHCAVVVAVVEHAEHLDVGIILGLERLDELIGTALLLGIVLALVDEFNVAPRVNIGPLLIGFLVFAIGLSFGANSGYAINPARDLGPRLFAWIQGWGDIAVPGNYANIDGYMWIPIVAPLVGGLVGALIYDFFIHNVLVARGPAAPPAGGVPEAPVGEPEPAGRVPQPTPQERPPGYAGSSPPPEE